MMVSLMTSDSIDVDSLKRKNCNYPIYVKHIEIWKVIITYFKRKLPAATNNDDDELSPILFLASKEQM